MTIFATKWRNVWGKPFSPVLSFPGRPEQNPVRKSRTLYKTHLHSSANSTRDHQGRRGVDVQNLI